ncbi:hypothetical protein OHU34_46145 (plasmid) [Streptomyces sp. NBC_00080]|uniref:hypothetical protein n=1 Tax=Streptomyces sp. NBC_00080 TaxID=2975645 RepID=UPI002F91BBC3
MLTPTEVHDHIRDLTDVKSLVAVQEAATARLLELDTAKRPVVTPGRSAEIGRLSPRMATPYGFCFPGEEFCAEANSTAVFHPMTGPDDDGLPCIEVGGVLVFAYLDADVQAVRVMVDLDTTMAQLVRGDSTVPLYVEVGNATVFSAGAAPVPASAWSQRLRRLVRQRRWMHWKRGN